MNYARVQKEVLAKLTKDPNAVVHCLTTDGRVCYVLDDQIGYIVPSDTNWIAVDKIMREVQLTSLRLPSCTADQLLTQTNNLLDSDGCLLRELHKTYANGRTVQVYIQEKHLKNFDNPVLYQGADARRGIIAIRENDPLAGDQLVGFVMPFVPAEK